MLSIKDRMPFYVLNSVPSTRIKNMKHTAIMITMFSGIRERASFYRLCRFLLRKYLKTRAKTQKT